MKFITKKDIALKRRRQDSHKGDNGQVLIIGGSQDYVGAPALAAMAALRSGSDIAVIAAPSKVAWVINTYSPDIITKKLSGESFDLIHSRELLRDAEKFDCVLIGNGIGQESETAKFTVKIIKNLIEMGKPMVIDADALKIIGSEDGRKANLLSSLRNVVLTPHQKEFEIMANMSMPINFEAKPRVLKSVLSNMNAADTPNNNAVILLKGRIDIIASRTDVAFNGTGNEGMTIGGTGDVLAGITASLISQKNSLFTSACTAAYVNGAVGDYLFKKKGIGFTASDIAEHIPYFMKHLR